MALKMFSGERYTFAASSGLPLLNHATDGAGGQTKFHNRVFIGSAGQYNGGGSGILTVTGDGASITDGPQIILRQLGSGNTGITFDQTSTTDVNNCKWTIGIDSSEDKNFHFSPANNIYHSAAGSKFSISPDGVVRNFAEFTSFAMYVENEGGTNNNDGINIQCGEDSNPSTGLDWIRFADGNGTGLAWIYGNGGTTPKFSGQAGSVASDIRNKRSFVPMASSSRGAQSIINGIDVFEYKYKSWDWMSDAEKARVDSEVRIGVSAQAIEGSSLSYIVDSKDQLNSKLEADTEGTLNPEDYGFNFKEVDYREIVPILIQTTKEQYATIQSLEARIVALENA